MAVSYTCDICGKKAASSHQVDRYQIRLDLCEEHLKAWVTFCIDTQLKGVRCPDVDHLLSRALMDAIIVGYKPVDDGNPIHHLHAQLAFFKSINTPI